MNKGLTQNQGIRYSMYSLMSKTKHDMTYMEIGGYDSKQGLNV